MRLLRNWIQLGAPPPNPRDLSHSCQNDGARRQIPRPPLIPAAESALGLRPRSALSSAQVLPEWTLSTAPCNDFSANGANPLNFVSHSRGSVHCDLYTNRHELIHVKRYGQSSTLSHHFAQGVVSGTLFARDTGFRKEANKKLPPSHRLADPAKPLGAHTVTYAVISKSQKPLNIPFFSKVTLNNARLTLQGLGYNVQLTKVSVEPAAQT